MTLHHITIAAAAVYVIYAAPAITVAAYLYLTGAV